jgi:4-amino-4-deoxy-L-arabinose transferase-like glycosyltransferase
VVSVLLYAFTRLYRIADYPIYFFSDEAVQTVNAADLVRYGFHDHWGNFLPTYFENEFLFNISVSVYLQVLPFLLFGRSVAVTRAVSALVTVLGTAAAALFLRRAFRLHTWWAAILFLAATPAWFLHSRTAFETALMVSLFAIFLYLYLLYRTRSPRYLYPALLCAGLAFYSYSPGQVVMLALLGALFLSDLHYHLDHRRTGLVGLLLLVLMAVPYLRFQAQHPGATYFHLRVVNSYWLTALPLQEKLALFGKNYFGGLNPAYWFLPNQVDLARHIMDRYGHILLATLPFAFLGLLICVRNFRSSPHRMVLIAALVSPVGGAMAETGVTRSLAFVVPAAMLTTLGLEAVLGPVYRRWGVARPSLAVLAALGLTSMVLLRQALVEGPTWTRDYGMGGMQYGGRQVFGEIAELLEGDPRARILLSPTWANGTDILARFFAPDEPRLEMLNIGWILEGRQNIDDHTVVVMTPEEYEQALSEPKLSDISLLRLLPYPDGQAGFHFVQLQYSAEADGLWEAEAEARHRPVRETIQLFGMDVLVAHSQFEEGRLSDIFDNDTFSLVRTARLNPAVLVFEFPSPVHITGVRVTTGSMDVGLTAKLYPPGASEPEVIRGTFTGLPNDPTVELDFDEFPELVERLELRIEKLGDHEEAQVHLREVKFR